MDRDFFLSGLAGTLGGISGVYVGSPLDVVKTRMQFGAVAGGAGAAAARGGVARGLADVVRVGGFRALFAGAAASALGQGPNNLIVFGV
jgi:solute carrier family 25 (mitochondrial carnitine/acylcarnitine transporter), member 20/29